MPIVDKLLWQREHRKLTGNKDTKKYEKTYKGKLMRTYRNMYTRISGMIDKSSHLYEGLPLLTKKDFYEWALSSDEYKNLFDAWVLSGYKLKLSPSIDRVDSSLGYTLSNMRWVTQSKNSRLGGLKKKSVVIKRQIDDGLYEPEFVSLATLEKVYGKH